MLLPRAARQRPESQRIELFSGLFQLCITSIKNPGWITENTSRENSEGDPNQRGHPVWASSLELNPSHLGLSHLPGVLVALAEMQRSPRTCLWLCIFPYRWEHLSVRFAEVKDQHWTSKVTLQLRGISPSYTLSGNIWRQESSTARTAVWWLGHAAHQPCSEEIKSKGIAMGERINRKKEEKTRHNMGEVRSAVSCMGS